MKLRKDSGITLISIIITIIILVILAVITIGAVYKMNIVMMATRGAENYAGSTVEESRTFGDTILYIEDALARLININNHDIQEQTDTNELENEENHDKETQIQPKDYKFDGKSIEDTGIYLFNEQNVHKNFELSFTIDNINDYTTYRPTLMNSAREIQAPYPGILFRIENTSSNTYKFLLQAHVNTNKKIKKYFPINDVQKVTIIRIDDITYYSINDDPFAFLADFSDLVYTFDIPVSFGGVINPDNTIERYFNGDLTNTYIKFLDDTVTIADYPVIDGNRYIFEHEKTFGGTTDDIMNTEVCLFSNANIHRNFEMYFEVNNVGENINNNTLMSAKDESGLENIYPGMVFRVNISGNKTKLVLKADSNSQKTKTVYVNIDNNNKITVRIIRINDITYYSINNAEYETLMDFTDIARTFDTPVSFGGILKQNQNGTISKLRPFNGSMSDMYVKFIEDDATLEDYQNALNQ